MLSELYYCRNRLSVSEPNHTVVTWGWTTCTYVKMVRQDRSQGKGMTSFETAVMRTMRITRSVRTLRDPGVPPQVGVGSRKVRTDLARSFATAASIGQILFLLWRGSRRLPPQVRAGSRKVRTDLARRFNCGRVGFVACVVALSSRCGAFVVLVSRVSPCWFLRRV